jgi:hypothetical protein
MDLVSRIAGWLGENEATISAVVGVTVLAGVVLAGLRSLVRWRGETDLTRVAVRTGSSEVLQGLARISHQVAADHSTCS